MPGTRPGRGRKWAIAGLWLGVLGLFWGCGGDSASVSTQRPRSLEGYQLQNEEWSRGWLAPERLAQRCDRVIVAGWDRSRKSGDPWAVFETLEAQSIQLPELGASQPAGMDGVRVYALVPGSTTLSTREHRDTWSKPFREGGWVCVQSEWRTVGYTVNGTNVFTDVDMNLHLLRTKDLMRAEARGQWRMEWSLTNDSPTTVPRWIGAVWKTGQWLEKSGTPRFVERWSAALKPSSRGGGMVDPLIVSDWDGDGREDLILAGANRWFRWDSASGWSTNLIIPFDDVHFQAASVADFDRDGHLDLLAPGGRQLQLFRGNGAGGVELPPVLTPAAALKDPLVMSTVDFDGDGDLDVWIGQYHAAFESGHTPTPFDGATNGPPTSMWRNLGNGRFEECLSTSGLDQARDRFVFSAVFLDTDGDHHPEFLQVSDFSGVDFFRGTGPGTFRLETQKALGEVRGFGMGHVVGDFDRDGRPDFMMIGMNSAPATRMEAASVHHPGFPQVREGRREMTHGNRVWLNRGGGRWEVAPWERQVAETGWAWGAAWLDSNNDGLGEFYVVNGFISNESAFDYQAEHWSTEVYQGGGEPDAARAEYWQRRSQIKMESGASEGGHHRNQWLVQVGPDWQELGWLGGIALPEDCRNVVAWDYDGDGRQDLLVVTQEEYPTPQAVLRVFHNEHPSGDWLAVRVPPRAGVSPWGSEVTLSLSDGSVRREWLVDQQGFRTQPPPIAHFGLGNVKPKSVKVRWPDGVEREELISSANRTLTVSRP